MRTNPLGSITARIEIVAILLLMAFMALAFSPPPASAASIQKEIVTLAVDEDTSDSLTQTLGRDGIIQAAYLVVPTTTSTTKTLSLYSWNGSTIGEIQIATATTTSTGVVNLTGLADMPVAGDVRVRISTDSNESSDRTFYLLIFIQR